jgi:hypothetical protein
MHIQVKEESHLLPWVVTKKQDVILMILVHKFPTNSLPFLKLPLNTEHASQGMLQLIISRELTNVNGSPYSSTFIHLQELQVRQKRYQRNIFFGYIKHP